MIIGDRLRELREEKKLSQGDVEKRTGLLRCYISHVENGHPVPARRNLGKAGSRIRGPTLSTLLRGQGAAFRCQICSNGNPQRKGGRSPALPIAESDGPLGLLLQDISDAKCRGLLQPFRVLRGTLSLKAWVVKIINAGNARIRWVVTDYKRGPGQGVLQRTRPVLIGDDYEKPAVPNTLNSKRVSQEAPVDPGAPDTRDAADGTPLYRGVRRGPSSTRETLI
jgi:transcriptional regulator with XRE-family HTH domain